MDLELACCVVIVTGASAGTGRATVELLAAEGAYVASEAAIEHVVTEVRRLPLGRLGTPEDVARVIVFLLSPASAQITGSEYAVDGGALRES